MCVRRTLTAITPSGWLQVFYAIAGCLLFCGTLAAQDTSSKPPALPSLQAVQSVTSQSQFKPLVGFNSSSPASVGMRPVAATVTYPESAPASDGPRRITLEQAKQQAAAADNPMIKLGQLQVEAAKQYRLGAESDYFPKLSSTFTNFHFNKFMGQEVTVERPVHGGTATLGLPLAGKDQTFVAVTAAQPLTPLLKLRQVVKLAQADENIARAKAGMPVGETSANVEKNYYGLLVAERELAIAKANGESGRGQRLLASNIITPGELADNAADEMKAGKELLAAESKVKEQMVSLNLLLGFPEETQLELIPPPVEFEEVSLKQATDKAMTANPEVVEAEQTVVKAQAGSTLSKLDYVPDFALMGGYAYNANAVPLLPRDFSFIGIMGSWNVFDFGKREHTIKERSAQLSAAQLALQLTKAKVAASVKSSYFELDRSRQLSELAHRMASTLQIERINYSAANAALAVTKAKLELEMLQADLDYRQALSRLKTLMGDR